MRVTNDAIVRASVKETLSILVSVLPLFVFWFIALGHSLFRLEAGIYAGIAVLAVMVVTRLTRGMLLWATAVFFAIALVFAVWLKNIWVIRHLGMMPGTLLFVAAILTMVAGQPFVQDYARAGVPPDVQESASFIRTCFVLTSFWALVFLVLALLNGAELSYPGPGQIGYLGLQLGVLITALAYQAVYIVRVKRRRLAAEQSAADSHRGNDS